MICANKKVLTLIVGNIPIVNKTQPLRLQRFKFRNIRMISVFVIAPKNRTTVYQQWWSMMTARSGRVCVETLLSINNRRRGVRPCDVTVERLIWDGKTNNKEIKTKPLDGFLSLNDSCVQALTTHIAVQSTCKSACTIIWPL